MIIETLQFLDLLNGRLHALILFFFVFVVIDCSLKKYMSFEPKEYTDDFPHSVSVFVTVFGESPEVFEKTLASVAAQDYENILEKVVMLDLGSEYDEELIYLTNKYNFKLILSERKGGKRARISKAFKEAKGEIVTFIDSDTILERNCITEIVKAFEDERVGGVQTTNTVYGNGINKVVLFYSDIIERGRNIINSGLTKHKSLHVIDGRCMSWKKEAILPYLSEFENDYFLGKKGEIGDDRQLTRILYKHGYYTVYQPTAKISTLPAYTFLDFIKQQLRWARSGYKYLILDIKEGLITRSWLYAIHSLLYYSAPFFFIASVLIDLFITPMKIDFFEINPFLTVVLILLGSSFVSMIRQIILFYDGLDFSISGIKKRFGDFLLTFPVGVVGLVVMFPLFIYAFLTVREQGKWITRNNNHNHRKNET